MRSARPKESRGGDGDIIQPVKNELDRKRRNIGTGRARRNLELSGVERKLNAGGM